MKSFRPRPILSNRVRALELVSSPGHVSHITPSSGCVLGLQLSGRILGEEGPLASIGVTGVQARTRRYEYDGPTETVLIRFTPQGVACLGLPAGEVAATSRSLEDLWSGDLRQRARDLMEQLHSEGGIEERLGRIEDFLSSLPFSEDRTIERALSCLESRHDEHDDEALVARVARHVGLSERQLERRFIARVGASPKRFASLRRFEGAQQLVRQGTPLVEVAAASGYADQSHFIREFKRFSGLTPSRWRTASGFIAPDAPQEMSGSFNPRAPRTTKIRP